MTACVTEAVSPSCMAVSLASSCAEDIAGAAGVGSLPSGAAAVELFVVRFGGMTHAPDRKMNLSSNPEKDDTAMSTDTQEEHETRGGHEQKRKNTYLRRMIPR
jgi:hypothetical protein